MRLSKGLNRDSIAEKVGVTHQQFAKYESGVNRLSIGKLLDVAKLLETDPSYFYSDHYNSGAVTEDGNDITDQQPRLRMNLELARNLQAIDSQEIQNALLHLTKKIANKLKHDKENSNEN